MAETKPKQASSLRTPKPKKMLGLTVPPALRLPHEDLITPKSEIPRRHNEVEGGLTDQTSMPSPTSLTSMSSQTTSLLSTEQQTQGSERAASQQNSTLHSVTDKALNQNSQQHTQKTSMPSPTSQTSSGSQTSLTRHSLLFEEAKDKVTAGFPISPQRDFTKFANSINREAVPSGLFTGKSKQLYDCLYSLTRGAFVPTRSIRISARA